MNAEEDSELLKLVTFDIDGIIKLINARHREMAVRTNQADVLAEEFCKDFK